MSWGWVALGVGVALWSAPLVQQFTGHPGNLTAIVSSLRDPVEPLIGLPYAFGAWGKEFGPAAPWLGADETDGFGYVATSHVWPAVAFLVVSTALGAVAARRRLRGPALLVLGSSVATVLGVIATSRVSGAVAPYLIRWWWPLMAVATAATVWAAVELAVPLLPHRVRRVAPVAVAAVGILATIGLLVTALPLEVPTPTFSTAIGHLVGPTARAIDHRQRYVLQAIDSSSLGATGTGLAVALDEEGYRVFVAPEFAQAMGRHHVLAPAKADVVLVVVSGEDRAAWPEPPGARLVASYDPLPPAERRRTRQLEARFRRALGAGAPRGPIIVASPFVDDALRRQGISSAAIAELNRLQGRGDAYFVYLVDQREGAGDAGTAPTAS